MALLQLWQAWRGGGMGAGHLPFSGGAAEQPACVMECLKVMEAAAVALKPKTDKEP